MPFVCSLFRSPSTYRRDEFLSGLKRHGYHAEMMPRRNPQPGDILLLWNRKGREDQTAKVYERAAATVLVAENGYINGADGQKRYALAIGQHNGAGKWRVGGPERFDAMGIELHAWRSGDEIVLLPQRGIGAPGVAMPLRWVNTTEAMLKRSTRRKISTRRHPGHLKTEPYEALKHAHCAVTWGSGAAIKALAHGIPVFHGLKSWIGAAAASQLDGADIERPKMSDDDRLEMFRRLAWAQWDMAQITSGEAFEWLLSTS